MWVWLTSSMQRMTRTIHGLQCTRTHLIVKGAISRTTYCLGLPFSNFGSLKNSKSMG